MKDIETGDLETLDHAINPSAARISPDGRYIAYVYRGSPQAIHVVSIEGDERYEMLGDGAHYPRWTRDGQGIYLRIGGALYFQEVTTEPLFRKIGSEREIALLGGGFDQFPSPVDDRVLISTMSNLGTGAGSTLNVVINWTEELNQLLPME